MNPRLKSVLSAFFGIAGVILMLIFIAFLVKRLFLTPVAPAGSGSPDSASIKAGLPVLPETKEGDLFLIKDGKRWAITLAQAPEPEKPATPEKTGATEKIVVEGTVNVVHRWEGPLPATFFTPTVPK